MTREQLESIVIQYMDSVTTMTLACCTHNKPWAAAVYYARQNLDLIFFSSPRSLHARSFAENPAAAVEIHGDHQRWQDIQGLQMEGLVRQVTGAVSLAKALDVYVRKYPFVRKIFSDLGILSLDDAAKMARVVPHVFRPHSILYLDNQGGFGNRWKLDVEGGQAVGEPVRG